MFGNGCGSDRLGLCLHGLCYRTLGNRWRGLRLQVRDERDGLLGNGQDQVADRGFDSLKGRGCNWRRGFELRGRRFRIRGHARSHRGGGRLRSWGNHRGRCWLRDRCNHRGRYWLRNRGSHRGRCWLSSPRGLSCSCGCFSNHRLDRSSFRVLDGRRRRYRLCSLGFRDLWLFGDRLLRLLAKPAEQAFLLASLGRRFFVVVGTKHGGRLSQGSDEPAMAHREFSLRRTDYLEAGWFMRNVLS
ncbi:Conserved Plasmodium protein [Pseudomonas putida]|uniref:Conserved Plasmodium protein n=1 Tax=Pseudomonas putida TaxID=303 RepID=A0A1L7NL76_PSEPU|nr:Conserved Plasmodium protein [Pseudomonas putida]